MLERDEISVTTVLEAVRAEPDVSVQAKWSAADAKELAKHVGRRLAIVWPMRPVLGSQVDFAKTEVF
jgi:hypothetical protein